MDRPRSAPGPEEETNSYQLPESLEKFSQRFLEDRTKAGGETPRHPLFEAIDQLLAETICRSAIW
ncbi:exonuclease V subunit beta [Escherichia coli]|uniref:Exonuclease V subunit beta n=1 Tax=Escherichia coli TaxID=562 RepID=A0A2X3K6A8_ECOLX|nr:exonuclease V subunit beta [Escherichia coli]